MKIEHLDTETLHNEINSDNILVLGNLTPEQAEIYDNKKVKMIVTRNIEYIFYYIKCSVQLKKI